jgi:hypothetical protein
MGWFNNESNADGVYQMRTVDQSGNFSGKKYDTLLSLYLDNVNMIT